jgi:tRNA A-37 threonylcarbamoyl transferase component Bud32
VDVLIGSTLINRYRIDKFLGRGGMAEVYQVWDTQRGVPLAMKVLREDLAEDRIFMRRFEREANNLTRLQHPNIVRCYGLGREGRIAFMLMDYIEGSTLRGEIFDADGPLTTERILDILHPICSALNYAHQMGMVHCDVKSANIMIHKNVTVYLTDFGIARGMDAATSTMVGIGTPAYMAPELIKGKDPTPQTDIYALGIVLYEMLTGGERPFTGERAEITGTTAEKVRWEHLKMEPVPVSQYNTKVTAKVEGVINRCLRKNPKGRFSSAMELLEAMKGSEGGVILLKEKAEEQAEDQQERIQEKPEREIFPKPVSHSEDAFQEEKKALRSSDTPGIGIALVIVLGVLLMIGIIPWVAKNNKTSATQPAYAAATKNVKEKASSEFITTATSEFIATAPTEANNEPRGKIVFTCQVDRQINHDQICIMNADGSGWKQLTDNLKYKHYYASFSSDGSKIVFSSSFSGGFEIFIMNSGGSGPQQLTSGMGEFYAPALSPDGRNIVAMRHVNGKNYITLLTSDGRYITDLNDYYDCKDPVWSPDGSEILFAANPNRTAIQFYVMNADGSNVKKLTEMEGVRGRSDWNVDGTMASYSGQHEKQNRELFLFGKNKSPQIITDGGDNLAPSFSPDGKWVTFMSYRDNFGDPDGCEIYIMRLEDGYTKRLTNNNYCDYQPIWGP